MFAGLVQQGPVRGWFGLLTLPSAALILRASASHEADTPHENACRLVAAWRQSDNAAAMAWNVALVAQKGRLAMPTYRAAPQSAVLV